MLTNTFNNDTDKLITSKLNGFNKICDEFSTKALYAATLCAQYDFVHEAYNVYYKTLNIDSASMIIEAQMKRITKDIEANTRLQPRIHYHLPPAMSFIRCWSETRGDDISAFRKTVLQVSKTQNPVKGIETGRGGFVVRGVAPIFSDAGDYLGSVEVFFGINLLVEQLTSNDDEEFSIFMDTTLLPISTRFLEDSASNILLENDIIGEYVFVEKTENFILSNLNDDVLSCDTVRYAGICIFQEGNYKYALIPILNFSGEMEGVGVLQVDIKDYIANLNRITVAVSFVAFLLILLVIFTNIRAINKLVLKRIFRADRSLKALAKGNISSDIEVLYKDEISNMESSLNVLNKFISKNTDFAVNLGQGKFEQDYKPLGEEDMLGNALVQMKDNLHHYSNELENKAKEYRKLYETYAEQNKLLVESEEKFRELSNLTFEGIIIHDIGIIMNTNHSFEKMIGMTKDELIGKDIIKISFPEKYHKLIREKLQLEYAEPYELEMQRKDGTLIPIEVESRKVIYNGKVGRVTAIRDITERKKSEIEIRKLSTAIRQAFVTVVITDSIGNIEYVNPYFEKLTGFSFEEIKGKNSNILATGKTKPESYKDLWDTIIAGKTWEGEFINRKKSGEEYIERSIITPVKDENNNITNFIAVKMDITDQKEIEKFMIRAKEKAEESDRLKSAFLANMSHEIRTPMTSIIGFSQMLDVPDLSDEQKKEFLDIIKNSSYRLLSIIDDIIDISKIEAGQIELRNTKTNLNRLIDELYKTFKLRAHGNKVDLQVSYGLPDDQCVIFIDTTKLNQILTNLINNALKFTEKGYIKFGYELKVDFLEFFVRDTGIGISKDQQDYIFERFRQVELTATKRFEGTGLGLPISKAFVEIMGGEIYVDSRLNEGSMFYFTIPYKPGKMVSKRPDDAKKQETDLTGKTILVVDDEIVNHELFQLLLRKTGVKLKYGVNGQEAVEVCEKSPEIDLVLMDIKMPVMNGYEATRKIKIIRPGLPIIAQTAFAFADEEQEAYNAGCNDYISKPIKKDLLIAKIKDLFGN